MSTEQRQALAEQSTNMVKQKAALKVWDAVKAYADAHALEAIALNAHEATAEPAAVPVDAYDKLLNLGFSRRNEEWFVRDIDGHSEEWVHIDTIAALAAQGTRKAEAVAQHCMCPACRGGVIHDSDCSVHNMPAYPNGPCDCSQKAEATQVAAGCAAKQFATFSETVDAETPLERLRFYCSLAMNSQDWIDAEPFFDALTPPSPAQSPEQAPKGDQP